MVTFSSKIGVAMNGAQVEPSPRDRRLAQQRAGQAPHLDRLRQAREWKCLEACFFNAQRPRWSWIRDNALRESGAGDLGVGRRVKQMATGFYGRVAAYDAGLSNASLEEALRRNVYGTVVAVDDGALRRLSGYLREADRSLHAQATDDLRHHAEVVIDDHFAGDRNQSAESGNGEGGLLVGGRGQFGDTLVHDPTRTHAPGAQPSVGELVRCDRVEPQCGLPGLDLDRDHRLQCVPASLVPRKIGRAHV